MSLFPIQHQSLYDLYIKQMQSLWVVDEVDLSGDKIDSIGGREMHVLRRVLAFFAAADSIVCDNLMTRFYSDIPFKESRHFLSLQAGMETVHSLMYSLLIDTLGGDEKETLYTAVDDFPAIKAKADYARRYMNDRIPLSERVIAFGCVEGIMFSASFAIIFWFKTRGKLHGLVHSNELIARDEALHLLHAAEMYKLMPRVEESRVFRIVEDAVSAEIKFIETECLDEPIIGLSALSMANYVRYVADYVLTLFGYNKLYFIGNPLAYMDLIGMQQKTNFFETRVSEYKMGGLGDRVISMDADF